MIHSAWREWWMIVRHPFRYVRYVAFRERMLREAFVQAVRQQERTFTYVGPVVEHEGGMAIDARNLPVS